MRFSRRLVATAATAALAVTSLGITGATAPPTAFAPMAAATNQETGTYSYVVAEAPASARPSSARFKEILAKTDQTANDAVASSASLRSQIAPESTGKTVAALSVAGIQPLAAPTGCRSGYTGKYIYTSRTQACGVFFKEIKVYYNEPRKPAQYRGSSWVSVRTTLTTNTKSGVVAVRNDVAVDRYTGNKYLVKPDRVDFDPRELAGYSRLAASSSPNGHNSASMSWTGITSFKHKSMAKGRADNLKPFTNRIIFKNFRVSDVDDTRWPVPNVRCDTRVRKQIGCVFNAFTPAYTFSKKRYPEFVRHIKSAIASGLPSTLSRSQSDAVRDANRAKACPRSLTKLAPKGKSCDEYPFASTKQGAAFNGGARRTFSWCSVKPNVQRTGKSGWSSCFINAEQNSLAGSDLGGFYSKWRVMEGDKFKVKTS